MDKYRFLRDFTLELSAAYGRMIQQGPHSKGEQGSICYNFIENSDGAIRQFAQVSISPQITTLGGVQDAKAAIRFFLHEAGKISDFEVQCTPQPHFLANGSDGIPYEAIMGHLRADLMMCFTLKPTKEEFGMVYGLV